MRKAARIILGTFLIILGLLALFTPLTPGSWLALIGLELLGASAFLPEKYRHRWHLFQEKLSEKWHKKIKSTFCRK